MKSLVCLCVAAILLISGCNAAAADTNSIENINNTLNDLLKKWPGGVPINLDLNMVNTMMEKQEQAIQAIKEKCKSESGREDAYEEAKTAFAAFTECMKPLLNFTNIKNEIAVAQPTGDLDTVFNKYCARRHDAVQCTKVFTKNIDPCLNNKERENRDIFVNMAVKGLDFVCHKEGDQIALFIAEKGPECFKDKADDLKKCGENTFAPYMPKDLNAISFRSIPTFDFDIQKCRDMESLSSCFVKALETCPESTPANLVDAMFRFVKNETPCKTLLKNRRALRQVTFANIGNNGIRSTGSLGMVAATILMPVITFLACRF